MKANINKRRYEKRAEIVKALAHPSRLLIVDVLHRRGELCVCDLCEVLRVTQPKISRHLAYLRRAHLVTVRREGKWKYYAVAPRPTGLEKTLLDPSGISSFADVAGYLSNLKMYLIIALILTVVFGAVTSAASALVYYHLKVQAEGVDQMELASVFD